MSFQRKQHLEKHFTKHTSERPIICETCGSSWKTKESLLIHSKTHTGESIFNDEMHCLSIYFIGELYSCQHANCAYRTPKLSHLKEHLQYHTKTRPFTCNVCNQTFMSKSHLLRHRKKHINLDNLQCQHCDYSTGRLDVLKVL